MQKSIIKYIVHDFKTSIITFIVVIVAILIFAGTMVFTANEVSFNGVGFACMIFMFVAALSTLPMGIRYMNQSGFSRKTAYKNYVVSFALISFGISLVIQVLLLLTSFAIPKSVNVNVGSEYNLLFGGTVANSFIPSVGWLFFAVFFLSSVGFFISMLYQKMDKTTKIGVSCGVPIFFAIVFPLIDVGLFGGVIYKAFFKAFMFICGFYDGNAYPLLSMGMFLAISIIIYAITYFWLVRKLNFK